MQLLQIISATLLTSLISLVGLSLLSFKINIRKITFFLISLASGTMLGAAFLHLIPESISKNPDRALLSIAAGVIFFFILEKFLIWRHCHHHQSHEDHKRPVAARMILAGDAIHNFIDGIIIATAFMSGTATGVSITIAIILHEIPQELGDFGVLIHGGMSPKKALIYNALSGTTSIAGGLITFFFLDGTTILHHTILPIAAGGFLYIALADLIPQLHEQTDAKESFWQILLFFVGFLLMYLLQRH